MDKNYRTELESIERHLLDCSESPPGSDSTEVTLIRTRLSDLTGSIFGTDSQQYRERYLCLISRAELQPLVDDQKTFVECIPEIRRRIRRLLDSLDRKLFDP